MFLSHELTISDVKETIAVRDKLDSMGTSLAEITELLAELKKAGIDIRTLITLIPLPIGSAPISSYSAFIVLYLGLLLQRREVRQVSNTIRFQV